MNAEIIKSSPKEANLSIHGSDIGTLYIIQHELLKDQQVEFVGVILRHPLTSEYSMRVNSSKGNPIREIEKATASAIEFAEDLKQTIHSKLKGV
ncbi:MAG: RpoL/Rpb11 RNA polymerase subunit family protein [Candidatus Nitrosotenuis sp.]